MKKLLCIAILLMLLLTACTSAAQGPAPTAGTQPTVTEPTPTQTEPPVTQPPTTQPPTTEPVLPPEPFVAHEKFSTESCSKLFGIWSAKIRLDWHLQNLDQFTGYTEFTLFYSFDEDGYFEAYVDPVAFDKAIENYEKMVIEHMLGLRYEAFRGPLEYQGVPEEKIREKWESGEKEKARAEVAASVDVAPVAEEAVAEEAVAVEPAAAEEKPEEKEPTFAEDKKPSGMGRFFGALFGRKK